MVVGLQSGFWRFCHVGMSLPWEKFSFHVSGVQQNEREMDDVRMHGTVIDRKNQRVRCKYCNKDMRGITRLKYHLACIRGDVAPCQEVPLDVKAQMGVLIREGRQRLKSKSGKLESSRLLRGRNNSTNSVKAFPVSCKDTQAAEVMEQKVVNLSPNVMTEKFYDNDTFPL
ncbi:hypothetical protein EJ110_NYTH39011 [Nymphaea thermarum]|nr:hypothetical protein EJ110_NYTH39011 [Nymphaea thermarum]